MFERGHVCYIAQIVVLIFTQKCCHTHIAFPSCVTVALAELRVQQLPMGFCMALSNNNHHFFTEFAGG